MSSYSDDDVYEARCYLCKKDKKEKRYGRLLKKMKKAQDDEAVYVDDVYMDSVKNKVDSDATMDNNLFMTPASLSGIDVKDMNESGLAYSSIAELEKKAKSAASFSSSSSSMANHWPDISVEDTIKATDFFLSIETEYLHELSKTHAHMNKERREQVMIHALFPKFISFFNSNFAPINHLPLNGVRPDTFFRVCSSLLAQHQ